ncbi:MAG: APC family permease [Aerococcus sp.]|nr:APC family permease [Aerococcus sp.]
METSVKRTEEVVVSEDAKFGLREAVLYGINAVIGSGIFLLPREIYADLGPASLLAIIVDIALVLLLAVCFAEVAGYFDKNGGPFQYSRTAFGNYIGFNVGILGWFVTIVAWAAMAAGFARLFTLAVPATSGHETVISIILVILLSIINSRGIKTSKLFTVMITIAKLIPIFAFCAIAVFFVKGGIDAGNFQPFVQLAEGKSIGQAMSSTALTIFYAFIGFETMPIVAGEMRDASRNVPKAIVSSVLVVSLLYFIILLGTIAMLGNGIMQSNSPVQDAFVMMIGPSGAWIITIGALISVGGLNMGDSLMIPRYGASIANEGLLPRVIGRENHKGAPIVAIIVSGALAILLLLAGNFEELAELSVVFRFFQYIPTALAVIVLRKKNMKKQPAFRLKGGALIPILGTVISVWVLSQAKPSSLIAGVVGVVVASALYFLLGNNKKERIAA